MTTDGIRRKNHVVLDTKKSAGTASATASAQRTSPGTVDPAPKKSVAVNAVDALDDVKGSSSMSGGQKQGVKAALAGLEAVEPKKKHHWFRNAVTSALIGLTLVTGIRAPTIPDYLLNAPQSYELVLEKMPVQNPVSIRYGDVQVQVQVQIQVQTEVSEIGGSPVQEPLVVVTPAQAEAEATTAAETPTTITPATVDTAQVETVRGGLPDVLAQLTSGMTVTHGSDPGDFYCEHAFFTSTHAALEAGSSILRNQSGEVMTGFLHVPSDSFTYDASLTPVQSERHADRQQIVGAAIRGFYEEARGQIDGDFRMLVTGYLQWGGVVNNPTGDFTGHTENIDAAMRAAFGADLLSSTGKAVQTATDAGGMSRTQLSYQVQDAKAPGGVRTVLIDAAQLPVSDHAINGGASSLQRLIEHGKPHAVLSMGVAGGSSAYQAEFHADDGGLRVDVGTGQAQHDDSKSPDRSHPDNYSLARAIHRGYQLRDAGPIVAHVVSGGGGN